MNGGLLRTLTPLGWLAAFGLVVVLMLILGRGLGVRWDPLHLQARRLEAVQRRADQAEAQTAARALEAAARGRQIEALDAFHQQAEAVVRATATAETRARTADDADTPLDPARAQRLRDHDRELCRLAPAVAGCAAASDPS
ncbi:hypothetical protein [Brevundimonas naejangsanensis]|uniref:hypothetical protein n=1 Tax=Brevundimonas naejangsanensis TaxID=588932 RepID=UPI00106B147E|nr:hypothetical protein [Brevundimonas naejangsanensis]QBQ47762.1 hypothetical protein E3U41_03135 [Brevundimonas naejangsanensis]